VRLPALPRRHARARGRPEHLIPPLRRIVRGLLREVFGFVPTLDLHGFRVRDALDETARFLTDAQASGETRVRIVYGKGRGTPGGVGVLRQAIPAWLEQHGGAWVERFEREVERDGNDGALRVWLRPPAADE